MELDTRKIYYVYEWYNQDTGEIFYVGKGRGKRCQDRAPADRNRKFTEYIKTNPNCTYRKVFENLDEETACNEEDKRIKELKKQGWCSCNLTDRTSHRGVLYGEKNGFYGKKHSEESLKKMREANSNGRNAGENNSQYGISPKERMSPEVYERWLYKQQHNKNGDMNGRAMRITAFNKNERHEFSCILYCCNYLRERFNIKLKDDSMITRISECIRCGLQYKGFYFICNDDKFCINRKSKFSVSIHNDIFEKATKKSKELKTPLTSIILFLIEYSLKNKIRFSCDEKKAFGSKSKILRIPKTLFDEWSSYIQFLKVPRWSAINQLLNKFINGEIIYES